MIANTAGLDYGSLVQAGIQAQRRIIQRQDLFKIEGQHIKMFSRRTCERAHAFDTPAFMHACFKTCLNPTVDPEIVIECFQTLKQAFKRQKEFGLGSAQQLESFDLILLHVSAKKTEKVVLLDILNQISKLSL